MTYYALIFWSIFGGVSHGGFFCYPDPYSHQLYGSGPGRPKLYGFDQIRIHITVQNDKKNKETTLSTGKHTTENK